MNDAVRLSIETYDVETIRRDFPILAERPYGKPLVYLDNAASAQKPKAVIDRLVHAYEHEYANVHRGLHFLANAATEAYEAARESVRRFLNAGSAEEIVFTRSATEAINLVAASYGLRPQPFYLGVVFAVAGLLLSVLFARDSRGHAQAEAKQLGGGTGAEPTP